MLRLFAATLVWLTVSQAIGNAIPTVAVGNKGNAPDQLYTDYNPSNLQFGAVSYDYRIGTTEVTNSQYVEFLNAKAASDPLALYNPNMGSDARGGIARTGVSGSYTYASKTNMGEKPVNYVSWYDAIRFANWLNNGQGSGDTETGAYTILGGTANPANGLSITRNIGATWFLPSENEWYKAAYYQPAAQGGDIDNYWLYSTRSNSTPTLATANAVGDISNPGANVANYQYGANWNSRSGNVTTVGSAGPLSDSFYGTADQGGNVWEWSEALVSLSSIGDQRGARGGSWFVIDTSFLTAPLAASRRSSAAPTFEGNDIGFRVATVPEPSTYVLGTLGLFATLVAGRSTMGKKSARNLAIGITDRGARRKRCSRHHRSHCSCRQRGQCPGSTLLYDKSSQQHVSER